MNNCKKTYAALRIQKPKINLEAVSTLFGLQPTYTKPDLWIYSTKDRLTSTDLDEHIFAITEPLMKRGSRLLRGLEAEGHVCDIFCYWLSEDGHGGPEIKPDTLTELACLGVKLGIDFYSSGTK